MEERFILGQQALTPDGAVYQIIWDMPYREDTTPEIVALGISERAPEDAIAGSTCIFNTEDADGYPVEWLFAFDGTNWALDRVVRGGSAGGGGDSDFTTAEVQVTLGNSDLWLYVPFASDGDFTYSAAGIYQSGTYQVILYKGKAFGEAYGDNLSITATGDVEVGDYVVTITGDCSITISGDK